MFTTQIIIDADETEHGWEIAVRFSPEDVIANYSDMSDHALRQLDLNGVIIDALLAERDIIGSD